jgi:hypothetical protein
MSNFDYINIKNVSELSDNDYNIENEDELILENNIGILLYSPLYNNLENPFYTYHNTDLYKLSTPSKDGSNINYIIAIGEDYSSLFKFCDEMISFKITDYNGININCEQVYIITDKSKYKEIKELINYDDRILFITDTEVNDSSINSLQKDYVLFENKIVQELIDNNYTNQN